MQIISTDQSQPFTSNTDLSLQVQNLFRKDIEDRYDCGLIDKQKDKSGCIIDYIKTKCISYLVIIIIGLIVFLITQIGIQYFQLCKIENEYKHNMNILSNYNGWDVIEPLKTVQPKLTQGQKLKTQNKKYTIINQLQKNIGEKSQQALNVKNQQDKSLSLEEIKLNEIDASKTQIDNAFGNTFDFDSSNLQNDLNFFTNSKTVEFSTILDEKQQPQIIVPQKQLQKLTYKIQIDENGDEIDYSSYTGITVDQVAKAKIWSQFKYFPIEDSNILIDDERAYFQDKYQISKYDQLPICVVVPSYNNAVNNRHISNMNSILMQQYSNYHIVFIDDASTDSTSDDIINLISSQTKVDSLHYLTIKNSQQKKAMFNLRMAANVYCKPQEIFIIIDGDDQLIGRQVFKTFNAVFQKTGAWFVYSNFLTINDYVGFSRKIPRSVISENSYREYPFVTSHLRAFYTQLFRNIREQDLRDEKGAYLKAANDVAICLPILEQAQNRVVYIPQITYFYNSDTGQNNHLLRLNQQKNNDYKLRQKPKYHRLEKLFDQNIK